jgi:hypothetical protein
LYQRFDDGERLGDFFDDCPAFVAAAERFSFDQLGMDPVARLAVGQLLGPDAAPAHLGQLAAAHPREGGHHDVAAGLDQLGEIFELERAEGLMPALAVIGVGRVGDHGDWGGEAAPRASEVLQRPLNHGSAVTALGDGRVVGADQPFNETQVHTVQRIGLVERSVAALVGEVAGVQLMQGSAGAAKVAEVAGQTGVDGPSATRRLLEAAPLGPGRDHVGPGHLHQEQGGGEQWSEDLVGSEQGAVRPGIFVTSHSRRGLVGPRPEAVQQPGCLVAVWLP